MLKRFITFSLATIALGASVGIEAHRGGWGGWYGGWPYFGFGWPFYMPYYAPYYGPYYAPRERVVEEKVIYKKESSANRWVDNAGYTYWLIYNRTGLPLQISGPNGEKFTAKPNQPLEVDHLNGWDLIIWQGKKPLTIKAKKHVIDISTDAQGNLIVRNL